MKGGKLSEDHWLPSAHAMYELWPQGQICDPVLGMSHKR